MAWDINNEEARENKVFLKIDGETEQIECEGTDVLGTIVKETARRHGLTAVNVLVNGEEISQEQANKKVSEFEGDITIVPKDSGSRTETKSC